MATCGCERRPRSDRAAPPDGVGSGGHRLQASFCGWSSCRPARCSTPPPDDPMLTALLQTAAALTVLNVAPPPVRHPDSAGAATPRGVETGWVIQPDQARRFLTLQHRSHLTESLDCLIAKSFPSPCSLQRIGPASVAPSQSTRGAVRPEQAGGYAGWQASARPIRTGGVGTGCNLS